MANENTAQPQQQPPQKKPGGHVIVDLTSRIAPIVTLGYRYRSIVILVLCCMAAFGVYSLQVMNKNEFPPFTVREGLIVAAYPGATTEQLEQEVMKPLEEYVFSYKEVDKAKTHSRAADGMVITYVNLDDKVKDTEQFWNKFKIGVTQAKASLPSGVLAVEVMSNFGNSSALLITMSSPNKTYRELRTYMDRLRDRLRTVPSVGEMSVTGLQQEQIAVSLDPQRLAHYGIGEKTIALALATQGFSTTGGSMRSPSYVAPLRVDRALASEREVAQQVVFTTPAGQVVTLADVATVTREYPEPTSYISNNGVRAICLSIQIKEGHNVVKMGREVEAQLTQFEREIPSEVTLYRITNQPYDVHNSVNYFLTELLIAVIAVVIAIMLLLPLKVALIAASTIPISIFISLALFYIFGIEINTVTLACLIVSLGMIVDNSVVIMDNYEELIAEGVGHKEASLSSATEFFKAIVAATLAISITFFPFLITMTGMFRDFLTDFPWAITIILFVSLVVAEMLVPFLQLRFIHKAPPANAAQELRKHFTLLGAMQWLYNKVIDWCFRWPRLTLWLGIASVAVGGVLFVTRPLKLMPVAERNQFAVELRAPAGTPLARTAAVADSLAAMLRRDPRVLSVAIFYGSSSPRFQATYAPQVGGSDYAQFIVNTKSNAATVELLDEYTPRYQDYFPGVRARFKQLSYSQAANPVEVRLAGPEYATLRSLADTVMEVMRRQEGLRLVRTSEGPPQMEAAVEPDNVAMQRLGLNATALQLALALRYSPGIPVASVWEGDYDVPVVLKTPGTHAVTPEQLLQAQIPTLPLASAPLGQFASVAPRWCPGILNHRNGVREVSVDAEIERGTYAITLTRDLKKELDKMQLPPGYKMTYGGEWEDTMDMLPHLGSALAMAVVIIFFILLFYYKDVRTALLLVLCLVTTVPGAAAGLLIMGQMLSLTCTLGLISLMGILVRNAIIMLDYANELRMKLGLSYRDASLASAKRRLRPIVLTSTAASMGVIPMMLSDSALWQPMGTVIFWGTLITLVYTLVFVPIAFWLIQPKAERHGATPWVKDDPLLAEEQAPGPSHIIRSYPGYAHLAPAVAGAKPYTPTQTSPDNPDDTK